MTLQPAASKSATSSRRARASWYAWAEREMSLRGNDQFRMVTGPARMQRVMIGHKFSALIGEQHRLLVQGLAKQKVHELLASQQLHVQRAAWLHSHRTRLR
jgi:hypothetical protein